MRRCKKLRQIAANARERGLISVAHAADLRLYQVLPSEKPGTLEHDAWNVHALEVTLTKERAFSIENFAMPDGRITIEEAFEFEAEYCNSIWPDGTHGRWRKIQEVTSKLGIAGQFNALVDGLRKEGWLLASLDEFGCPLIHELVFARKAGDASPRFRLLLSLCSTAGLAVLAGWADQKQPAEKFLVHLKTEVQLVSLLRKLG